MGEPPGTRIVAGEKIVSDASPYWLVVENGQLALPLAHKPIIARINRECRNGLGVRAITKLFNAEPRVPTFSGNKYWSSSTIQKILESRETFGEVTFYRVDKESEPGKVKRIPVLTVPDYYPRAITETDYILAKEAHKSVRPSGQFRRTADTPQCCPTWESAGAVRPCTSTTRAATAVISIAAVRHATTIATTIATTAMIGSSTNYWCCSCCSMCPG